MAGVCGASITDGMVKRCSQPSHLNHSRESYRRMLFNRTSLLRWQRGQAWTSSAVDDASGVSGIYGSNLQQGACLQMHAGSHRQKHRRAAAVLRIVPRVCNNETSKAESGIADRLAALFQLFRAREGLEGLAGLVDRVAARRSTNFAVRSSARLCAWPLMRPSFSARAYRRLTRALWFSISSTADLSLLSAGRRQCASGTAMPRARTSGRAVSRL